MVERNLKVKNFIIYDLETEENYTIIVDGENTEDSDSEHDVIIQEQQDKGIFTHYSFIGSCCCYSRSNIFGVL